jgi:hypothetical protein
MKKTLLLLLLFIVALSQYTAVAQENPTVKSAEITQDNKEKLTILTNPVKEGFLKLTFTSSQNNDLDISIINSLGKEVYRAKRVINSDIQVFDVSQISAGIYFLRVSTNNSNFVKKLIVR